MQETNSSFSTDLGRPEHSGRNVAAVFVIALALLVLGAGALTLGNKGELLDPLKEHWGSEAAPEDDHLETGEIFSAGDGLDVTVSTVEKLTDLSGTTYTCGTVKLKNTGGSAVRHLGASSWRITPPGGEAGFPTATGFANSLNGGTVEPGADASGIICAPGGESGRYTFEYAPVGSGDEAVWFGRV